MSDTLLKLRVLWYMLRSTAAEWRSQAWEKDLDGHYCCNGHECGCYAMTRREMWIDHYSKKS